MIHSEKILQCNRRIRLSSSFHTNILFGFNRLVEAITIATSRHDPSRVLIHNVYFALLDDVLFIFHKKGVGLEQLIHRMNPITFLGKRFVELC